MNTMTGNRADEREDKRSARAAGMRENRRRALLDASLRVFSERGYHATRISDLIEAAGVARGTFYIYFESKEAIFHELVDEMLVRIRSNVDGVETEGDAPPLQVQLLNIVKRVLLTFHENPELTRLILRSAPGSDDEVDRKLNNFYEQLHTWLSESLSNGQKLGWLRKFDCDVVSWAIIGSVRQLIELSLDKALSDEALQSMTISLLEFSLMGVLIR